MQINMLLRESINVLLEGVPEGMDLEKIQQSLLDLASVQSLHDLHVWSISSEKVSLTMHIVSEEKESMQPALLASIQSLLAEKFEIHHTTIQIESQPCEQANVEHSYGPST